MTCYRFDSVTPHPKDYQALARGCGNVAATRPEKDGSRIVVVYPYRNDGVKLWARLSTVAITLSENPEDGVSPAVNCILILWA